MGRRLEGRYARRVPRSLPRTGRVQTSEGEGVSFCLKHSGRPRRAGDLAKWVQSRVDYSETSRGDAAAVVNVERPPRRVAATSRRGYSRRRVAATPRLRRSLNTERARARHTILGSYTKRQSDCYPPLAQVRAARAAAARTGCARLSPETRPVRPVARRGSTRASGPPRRGRASPPRATR